MLDKLLRLFGLLRELVPAAAPAPLLTYRKTQGGWFCFYRGAFGFGLTKRDAAKAAIKASVAP